MLSSDSCTSDGSSECDSDSQLTPAAAGSTVHEEITPDVADGSAELELTSACIEYYTLLHELPEFIVLIVTVV